MVAELAPEDDTASSNALLELHPGVGGDEAGVFAHELFGMYQEFVRQHKPQWRWETLELRPSGSHGVSFALARVSSASPGGELLYGLLRCESGVHRVQRVPRNADRVHTSTARVFVLPEAEEGDPAAVLDEAELRVETYRAGGAGGQHVNKTSSAVRITHVPTGLSVAIEDERSQHMNRKKALAVLKSRLLARREGARRAAVSELKGSLVASGERSEKVRSFHYARDTVVDHRLPGGSGVHGVAALLSGSEALETDFMLPLYAAARIEACLQPASPID